MSEQKNELRQIITDALIGLGVVAASLPETADPYCEMVTIYQQSGGQYGWPDYRGNYNEVCRHEK